MKKIVYEKWRELSLDPFKIKFNNIILKEIISYPYAGNDVIECNCEYKGKNIEAFIKIERSKVSGMLEEKNNLELLYNNNYYKKIPRVFDYCIFNEKNILVLEKMCGNRLSEIIKEDTNINIDQYLKKYGEELSIIHSIPYNEFGFAKQRVINDIPKIDNYPTLNNQKELKVYLDYLSNNKPIGDEQCFIHGDFHYANILWNNNEISGVLDFEYSGIGFKEQDIAWAIILRPTQCFLDNINDIKQFILGYKNNGTYNSEKLKWCLINGYCHFYLMNIKNEEYKEKLLELMRLVIKEKL